MSSARFRFTTRHASRFSDMTQMLFMLRTQAQAQCPILDPKTIANPPCSSINPSTTTMPESVCSLFSFLRHLHCQLTRPTSDTTRNLIRITMVPLPPHPRHPQSPTHHRKSACPKRTSSKLAKRRTGEN